MLYTIPRFDHWPWQRWSNSPMGSWTLRVPQCFFFFRTCWEDSKSKQGNFGIWQRKVMLFLTHSTCGVVAHCQVRSPEGKVILRPEDPDELGNRQVASDRTPLRMCSVHCNVWFPHGFWGFQNRWNRWKRWTLIFQRVFSVQKITVASQEYPQSHPLNPASKVLGSRGPP